MDTANSIRKTRRTKKSQRERSEDIKEMDYNEEMVKHKRCVDDMLQSGADSKGREEAGRSRSSALPKLIRNCHY